MRLSQISSFLESYAPLHLQEDYDNSGLIVGNPSQEIEEAIISLDCTEAVIDEAIRLGCNLVISHHPIVFKGLKRFNNSTYVERVIAKAIKNDIAIYAIHTNLDNIYKGVNAKIAAKLSLQNPHILSTKSGLLHQLAVYVPPTHEEVLRNALFEAGAGDIGNYSGCSFNQSGFGTFTANEEAHPYIGDVGKRVREEEVRIEVIYPKERERRILLAMYENHPYEEVAYNVYHLENDYQHVGSGMIGTLEPAMSEYEFLSYIKERLQITVVRHTNFLNKRIKRVAVCGGSGSFLLKKAIWAGADVFVTADFKYHEFFDAENKTLIADIGHFESEQFTQDLLLEIIQEKFPNFAVRLTGVNTNPIKYYF